MKNNKSTKANVPNLRFPEFTGGWEESPLANECIINPKTSELENEFVYIDLESVVKGVLININLVDKLEAPSRAQRVLSHKDILFQCVRPYQLNNYIYYKQDDRQWVASTGYAQIRTNHNINFIYQLLNSPRFNQKVMLRCTGTSYPAIASTDLGNIPISICSDKEQKKIGDLLALIDRRIETQSQIIKELETLMKDLSSKLFSQELRFTDGDENSFADWEYSNLKSFGTFMRGLTYGSRNVSNEGLLVLRSSNIQNNTLILDKDTVFVDKDCSDELLLQKGDIVICMSNGSKSLVGKNAEYIGNYSQPITIGAFCSLFRPQNKFAKFILQTEIYEKFVLLSIGGGNISNLKNSDLENYTSLVPTDKKEQQQIMNILDSLSNKIKIEQSILSAYRKQKKYFLTHMFI